MNCLPFNISVSGDGSLEPARQRPRINLTWVGTDAVEYAWEDNSAIEDGYVLWVEYWYSSCNGDSGLWVSNRDWCRPRGRTSADDATRCRRARDPTSHTRSNANLTRN